LQVPAGTVKPGEDIELALLREVLEETGLENVRVARKLAVYNYLNPETGQVNERHIFHLSAADSTPDFWEWIETDGLNWAKPKNRVPDHEGYVFQFYWVDLRENVELAGNLGDYLHTLAR
jgi:8-oxo-dGTP pyrophosphatase MutT (NUDIX family)